MEIVYLYCAFSYLFVAGFFIRKCQDRLNQLEQVGALIFAPFLMPFLLGANFDLD